MNKVLRDQSTSCDQNIPASSPSATNPLKESEPKNQILVLNGVRAVACIIVFSTHLHLFARHRGIWPLLQNTGKPDVFFVLSQYFGDFFGASGVILFFLLSSFLLFLPYGRSPS